MSLKKPKKNPYPTFMSCTLVNLVVWKTPEELRAEIETRILSSGSREVFVRGDAGVDYGAVVRLIGVLKMEDDGGIDDKLIALPIEKIDPFQAEIQQLSDLPIRHRDRIWHFFENYKGLEEGKWSKILGWGEKDEAEAILMDSIARHNAKA